MRGKTVHGHQRTRLFACPYCGKQFEDVLRHLNHRESNCSSWFTALPPGPARSVSPLPPEPMDTANDISPPPSLVNPEPTGNVALGPQLLRVDFPHAGKIYGRTKSFIDRLNDNQYASHRVQNPYYPFADQEEWELGSFLLCSGMSMQKVDEFLRLKLVLEFLYIFYPVYRHPPRSRVLALRSILRRTYGAVSRSCQVYRSGSSSRSH